jgi:hypothetical protein
LVGRRDYVAVVLYHSLGRVAVREVSQIAS